MGLFKRYLIFIIFTSSVIYASEEIDKRHLLFLLHNHQVEKAFSKYQEFSKNQRDDFELLEQLCLLLIENGSKSQDIEIQKLSIIGAGLANSSKSISMLENGLHSPDPQTELLALHFLKNFQDDRINHLLTNAMKSDFLPIRMEAAYLMSERKHPHAAGQIEALMYRLPPQLRPYFPTFFTIIGTPEATTILKNLMCAPEVLVRIESIINAVLMNRDDLLPIIRKRVTHGNTGELEAAAFALGKLKDTSKISTLEQLAQSQNPNVHLAANHALCLLGDLSKKEPIIEMARHGNIFAINALAEITDTDDVIYSLCHHNDLQVRSNAAIALLIKKDPRCLPFMLPLLISDEKDLALQPTYSVGRAFLAWKIVPSAQAQTKDPLFDIALSHNIKEYLLREAIELPEDAFLVLANILFAKDQKPLLPELISLLENLQTDKAIELLKNQLSKLGSPLVRDYCQLALYRMDDPSASESYIQNWVISHKNDNLMDLTPSSHRPMLPKASPYQLTNEEKTRLLIDMYTALASKQNSKNTETLVDALISGNEKNRYLLAGLLLRSIE